MAYFDLAEDSYMELTAAEMTKNIITQAPTCCNGQIYSVPALAGKEAAVAGKEAAVAGKGAAVAGKGTIKVL